MALQRPCSLFLFDLDGTLIDSREDIAAALNRALKEMLLPPVPVSEVTALVGGGVQKLAERALRMIFGEDPESALVLRCIDLFREEYGAHLVKRTRLYPGVKRALDLLAWADLAVVSNKPEHFCRQIVHALGIEPRFRAVVGEKAARPRKPDPALLLLAMELCGGKPQETVMVGDSGVDIEAGHAAGVQTCGVLGGYRPREELESAGCDLIVRSLPELADHFRPA